MKLVKLSLAASLVAFAGSAAAVTQDGLLDTTSTGTADVLIVKQNAVQLTDLDDLDFGAPQLVTADLTVSDDVCVFSTTGGYSVSASSPNAFSMVAGTDTMAYDIDWNGSDIEAAAVTGTGDSTSLNCGGGTNATIVVTIAEAAFNAAPPGNYVDTVTLTVSPN